MVALKGVLFETVWIPVVPEKFTSIRASVKSKIPTGPVLPVLPVGPEGPVGPVVPV